MTDKDKIRAEIETLKERHANAQTVVFDYGNINAANFNAGKVECCRELLSFIDTLPSEEEPVHCTKADVDAAMAELAEQCRKFTEEYKKSADDILAEMRGEKPVSNPIDFEKELYKAFGQVKDFTLGMRIAKRFYEMGRNHQGPVSEDLEGAAREYAGIPKDSPHDLKYCVHDKKAKYNAVLYGANWKKQQMERYRIEHCNSLTNEQSELEETFVSSHVEKNNRIPTFIDAIEYGMSLQKEQMMANAVDATVHIDAGGYPYIPQIELYDYDKDIPFAKEGDKYKVILIKED